MIKEKKRMNDKLLVEVIKKMLGNKNITPEKAAKKLGIGRTTYFDRLKNPDEFTRGEIRILCRMTGMKPEDFYYERNLESIAVRMHIIGSRCITKSSVSHDEPREAGTSESAERTY